MLPLTFGRKNWEACSDKQAHMSFDHGSCTSDISDLQNGDTALHLATRGGHEVVTALLLAKVASLQAVDQVTSL
jgi:hypothetical protein